jgi:hypothetical protein
LPHRAASELIIEHEEIKKFVPPALPMSVSYFLDHGIPVPWGCETPTTNQDMAADTPSDSQIEPPAELFRKHFLQDLAENAEYTPSACHFSPELFAFSFVADIHSSLGYQFI